MLRRRAAPEDLDTLSDAADNIAGRSFCALGDAAATPILSSFKYFRSEFDDLIAEQPRSSSPELVAELTGAPA